MIKISENTLSVFSFVTTGQFISIFIARITNSGRLLTRYGPCLLKEIPWFKEIVASIIIGLIAGLIGYYLDKAEKANGKETHFPRIRFKDFASAILFYTTLFFSFLFLFVIREYNKRMSEVAYMFRKTFWQFCSTQIPWTEIVITSLIFGIILAIGFSTIRNPAKET